MLVDPYSYTSFSRVKTLFLPLTNLSVGEFYSYFEHFKSINQVRLSDISPPNGTVINKFNPQAFPNGNLLFYHQLSQINHQEIFLQDFEPFRKIFVIVGFIKYFPDLTFETLKWHLKNLKKVFKYSIVYDIVILDCPEEDNLALRNSVDSPNIHFHSMHSNNSEYNIMCDISHNFIENLHSYAESYQHVTLRSPGSINSTDVLKISVTNTNPSTNSDLLTRSNSGLIPTTNSPTNSTNNINNNDTDSISNDISATLNSSRNGSSANLPDINDDSLSIEPANSTNKKKEAKNKGRHLKVNGNFYLLSGRYVDALQSFADALPLLKSANDYLWLANSLECLGVCLVLLDQLAANYSFPSALVKFLTNKDGKKSSSNNLNLQVPEIIEQITNKVLLFYSFTFLNYEDYVPQLVYCECILRYVKFMTTIHLSDGYTQQALDHIVLNKKITEPKVNEFFFKKIAIYDFSNKVFSVQIANMTIQNQCKIYVALAAIFDDLSFFRKKTFMIRTLLLKWLAHYSSINNKKGSNTAASDFTSSLMSPSFSLSNETNITDFNEDDFSQIGYPQQAILNDASSAQKSASNGLIFLLETMVQVYGILNHSKQSNDSENNSPWFVIHKNILYLCMNLCFQLMHLQGIIYFSLILLSKYLNVLTKEEQKKIYQLVKDCLRKNVSNKDASHIRWWDPYLIRDIEVLDDFDAGLTPFRGGANTSSLKQGPKSAAPKSSTTVKSPFYFNPFDKKKDADKPTTSTRKIIPHTYCGLSDDKDLPEISGDNPDEFIFANGDNEENKEKETLEDVIEKISADILLVQNEIFTLLLTVQNPFLFEIELSDIQVMTSQKSVKLETLPAENFTIAANSLQVLQILCKPSGFGNLQIIGANIKILETAQFFKIINSEKIIVLPKIKSHGVSKINENLNKLTINSVDIISDTEISQKVLFKNLNLTVITPQPILSLIDLSLNNGWIMLLEGEKSSFNILLKNLSDIKINYLAFSFTDSTIEPLNKALQQQLLRDLPINEIYEIEYYLLKRKPLRVQKGEVEKLKFIKPLDYLSLGFDIKGKRGMRDAQVILEYGNHIATDPNSSEYSNFYRRISIPISVTVSPSVELAGCDLIPLFNNVDALSADNVSSISESIGNNDMHIWSYLNKRTKKISDYCLLVIDLRNSWNQKFKVVLKSSDFVFATSEELGDRNNSDKLHYEDDENNKEDEYVVSETIAPGHTERFILPIKRIEFSTEYLDRAIPSLRNKQFIVQDTKYSKQEYKYIREAFWYRKELLRHIKGKWIEEGSSREGHIELRGIRLSQRMVSVLRIEKIGIEMCIFGGNTKNSGFYWEVDTEDFVTVKTKITNRSNYVLKGILRHVPLSGSLSGSLDRKLIYNGVLQVMVDAIAPGESKEVELGVVILEKGEYEWGAIFDELLFNDQNVDLQHTQREPLYIRAI